MKLRIFAASCLVFLLNLSASILLGQISVKRRVPDEVISVLIKAGKNGTEIQKAIDFFYSQGDSLKIAALNFLIRNMDIHRSASYYFTDASKNRVPFNEFDFADFKKAEQVIESNLGNGKRMIPYVYRDIDSIKSEQLIETIEKAFLVWDRKGNQSLGFNDFCEYVLPYRVSFEPLQSWRTVYADKFEKLLKQAGASHPDSMPVFVGREIKNWFTNTYVVENRNEPLPRLGAMQLLFRKKGACEDIADLAVFMLRSMGYASSVDFIPGWATSSGLHYVNFVQYGGKKKIFDAADGVFVDTLLREPAKVIRTTYSKQVNTVVQIVDTSMIPESFMRLSNYIDVTDTYWVTDDIRTDIFPLKGKNLDVAFLSVWNFSRWKPVWWGKVQNNKAVFTNMSKGAVYLPMFYIDKKLFVAGWPVVLGYKNTVILKPDTISKQTIHIKEQAQYLSFRTGRKYTLYYWNNKWEKLGTQTASDGMTEFVFPHVPKNSLLLFIPDYSKGKERPFTISANGERSWY